MVRSPAFNLAAMSEAFILAFPELGVILFELVLQVVPSASPPELTTVTP